MKTEKGKAAAAAFICLVLVISCPLTISVFRRPDVYADYRDLDWSYITRKKWSAIYPVTDDDPPAAEEEKASKADGAADEYTEEEMQEPEADLKKAEEVEAAAAGEKKKFDLESFRTDLRKDLEKAGTEKHPLSPFYYRIYGSIAKLLGKRRVENKERDVYRMADGSLNFTESDQASPAKASKVADFADWLKGRGIPFISVTAATKSDSTLASFPSGVKTYGYENEMRFTAYLAERGVDTIDSMTLLKGIDPDLDAWFFRTDHHWNADAGITMARFLGGKLTDELGIAFDSEKLDQDRFTAKTYEKVFLGSQGKKAKLGYTEREDIKVYYPEYETSFKVEVPDQNKSLTGPFEDTIIDRYCLENKRCFGYNIYNYYAYWAFAHGDNPLVTIDNELCPNDTRLLIVKTSKANVVDSYLACGVKRMDILDNRYFYGSIKTYIKRNKPDAVIMITGAPSPESDNHWIIK